MGVIRVFILLCLLVPSVLAGSTVVRMSESGFEPSVLEIKKGDIVVFENVGKDPSWPASNTHPTHELYSDFDAKDRVLPGSVWSFKFSKPGTWKFHDHLNPILTGTVVVKDSKGLGSLFAGFFLAIAKWFDPEIGFEATAAVVAEVPAEPVQEETQETSENKLAEICTGDKTNNFECYEAHYTNLVESQGLTAGFDDVKKRYETSGYVKAMCHPLSHVLGHLAVEIYPDVSEAFKYGDSFCWSGYYHGVMEAILGKVTRGQLVSQINIICSEIPGKETKNFHYFNCVHGAGHGFMAVTGNELFDSLKLCDEFDGEWEQFSCYGGVYMENVMIDNRGHTTKYLNPEDLAYPCNKVDTKYKEQCFLMQTSYMLKVTNRDFAKVFEVCSSVEEPFDATCYQSLGRDASGQSSSNVERTKITCDIGKDFKQKSNCLVGAVKDFISYYHSDKQARDLCNSVDPELRPICGSTLESYYALLT